MIRNQLFSLLIICFPIYSFSDFDSLGKNPSALESSFNLSASSLKVIQKRHLPRKFLSEASIGVSSVLKGFNYINSYSSDLSYRFFINSRWSVNFKYSRYMNLASLEGRAEVIKRGQIPLDMKYPQKHSFMGGVDWYIFYGKALLYNRLVRFDLYTSFLAGVMDLINWDKKTPLASSLSMGFVHWWHEHFNTRIEVQGIYYKYELSTDSIIDAKSINRYLYKIHFSAGFLF